MGRETPWGLAAGHARIEGGPFGEVGLEQGAAGRAFLAGSPGAKAGRDSIGTRPDESCSKEGEGGC
jgi:hypothetical protein